MRVHPTLGLAAIILPLLVAAGCSDDDPVSSNGASSSSSSSSGSSTSGSSSSSSGGSSSSSGGSSTSSSSSGGSSSSSGGPIGGVPTSPGEMFTWLQKGDYKAWAKESASHQSTGPHGGKVKTFVNASLETSLAAKNAQHPKGAASVKEFVDNNDVVTGWAVSVKTQDDSAKGAGWYWYEVFSTTSGASPIEGQAKPLCVNCHAGGADYVLIPFPLK